MGLMSHEDRSNILHAQEERKLTEGDRDENRDDWREESRPAEITISDVSGSIKIMKFSRGFMDLSISEEIRQSFEVHYKEGDKWLFHLCHISFLDSEAIKALLQCIKGTGRDRAAIICDGESIPFRVLKLFGMTQLVQIYNTTEQGLQSLTD